MDSIIEEKLQILTAGSAVFGDVAGAVNILSVDFVMKRIINDWNLSTKLLYALAQCDTMIATIEEQSDRKTVADRIGDMFGRYIALWHKNPSVNSDSYTQLISRFLGELAHAGNGSVSKGLRQELYIATAVLLFVGYVAKDVVADVWKWALIAASQQYGQPLQQIGLAITSKIAHHGYAFPLVASFWSTEWLQYLAGLLHGHRALAENGPAQWSRGIDVILRVAESHRNLWPTMLHYSISLYSRSFSVVNAGVIFHLLQQETGTISPDMLSMILVGVQSLPNTSEEETLHANSTKAELFGACARYLAITNTENTELWDTLLKYFTDMVSRTTGEQLYEWSAALLFACFEVNAEQYVPLADCVIRNITASTLDAGNSVAEEGFTRVCNNLHLARVICQCMSSDRGSGADEATLRLIKEIASANSHLFASPYRVVRHDFAAVLANLAIATPSPLPDFEVLCGQLTNYSDNSTTEKSMYYRVSLFLMFTCSEQIARDMISKFIQSLMPMLQLGRCKHLIPKLLSHAIRGCGSGDIDFSKNCHSVCIQVASSYRIDRTERNIDAVLQCYTDNAMNESLHVRETCIAAVSAIYGNNGMMCNESERKLCRDILTKGFCDAKPEVQLLSQAGMVVYLSSKSLDEIAALSASYTKNLDILSQRYRTYMGFYNVFACLERRSVAKLEKPLVRSLMTCTASQS